MIDLRPIPAMELANDKERNALVGALYLELLPAVLQQPAFYITTEEGLSLEGKTYQKAKINTTALFNNAWNLAEDAVTFLRTKRQS